MSAVSRGVQGAEDPLAQPDEAAIQAAAIRRVRGLRDRPKEGTETVGLEYPGLVTRAVAFAVDATIVNAVAALTAVTIGLAVSVLHLPSQVDTAIAAVSAAAWVIWSICYFAFFWSTTGQTPGDRMMRIRVIDRHGHWPIKPLRSVVRFAGLILAALPLLAGFLIMLWDDRRRCLQDRLAHTLVIYAPRSPPVISARRPTPPASLPPAPMPPASDHGGQPPPAPIPRA